MTQPGIPRGHAICDPIAGGMVLVTIKLIQDDCVFVQGIVVTSNTVNKVVYSRNPPQYDVFSGLVNSCNLPRYDGAIHLRPPYF